ALPRHNSTQRPSPDDTVCDPARISQERLAFSEGKFNQIAKNKNVPAVGIRRPIIELWSDGVVVAVITQRFRPGVMSEKLVSLGEALFRYHLERVVRVGGIAAIVVDLLCPTEFLEEWFSLIRIEASI